MFRRAADFTYASDAAARGLTGMEKRGGGTESRALSKIANRKLFAHVLRGHVEGDHEAVGAFELEGLLAFGGFAEGFDVVFHEDEAFVARDAPVLEVLDDDRIAGVAFLALENDLAGFSAVEFGDGLI